jgi:formylglycine-generating enzyme required for sulfatase activity
MGHQNLPPKKKPKSSAKAEGKSENEVKPKPAESKPVTKPPEASPEEQALWDSVKESTDPIEIQAYLNRYPNGRYSANAKKLMELMSWNKIKGSQNPSDYDQFLSKFPEGEFSSAAKKARTDIELGLWNRVKDSQNPDELNSYLTKFPNGTFSELAKAKLINAEKAYEESLWNKVKDSQNIEDLDGYLSRYPNGRFTTTAREKKAQLGPMLIITKLEKDFVRIQPGEFMMGGDKYDVETPIHRVRISQGFEIGKYEVTQAQWEAVMGSNQSNFKGADLPVENVSWNDVQEFIRKLNSKSTKYNYRLPTEAEWEYACRAGTTGDYAGNLDSMGWYESNSGSKTHPVGQKQANGWGIYDMHGNVWEWCQDWYGDYSSNNQTDPQGAGSGSSRVFRGGSWYFPAEYCRSAYRNYFVPVYRLINVGFRLLRNSR